jgi:hypothetical protein
MNDAKKRMLRSIMAAMAIALTLVTCGPGAMESVGDAMVDAADVIRDAGQDAADTIRDSSADAVEAATDTGATVLDDTGTAITDAAGGDAAAQDSCTTCTSTGAGHSVSASEDPAQSVGGTIRSAGPDRAAMLTAGPLYITDMDVSDIGCFGSGCGPVGGILVSLPSTSSCDDVHLIARSLPSDAEVVGWSQALFGGGTSASTSSMHGARVFVPAGRQLCGQLTGGSTAQARWAGFRPYD